MENFVRKTQIIYYNSALVLKINIKYSRNLNNIFTNCFQQIILLHLKSKAEKTFTNDSLQITRDKEKYFRRNFKRNMTFFNC